MFPDRGDGEPNKNNSTMSTDSTNPKSPFVASPQYMFIPMDNDKSNSHTPKPPASHVSSPGKRPNQGMGHRQAKVKQPETGKSIESQQQSSSNTSGSY